MSRGSGPRAGAPGPDPAGGGRRRVAEPRERTISSTTLLAMVVPLLTVLALATVHPAPTEEAGRPPTPAALTRATVVCPPALPGAAEVLVAAGTADDASPAGELRLPQEEGATLPVTPGRVSRLDAADQVVLVADDRLAPGLVASRTGSGAATACVAPRADTWFTGVGAGAEHRSVLQLVNPDGGPAVADVTVLGEDGVVEVPALRGLTVKGRRVERIDLSSVVPRREDLTLRVQVSRGRLASSVLDRYAELGGGPDTSDWMPGQQEPATTSYLLGLGGRAGDRTLVVANGGPDEARVGLRLVTSRSEPAPAGFEELRVPPGSTTTLDLTGLLGGRAAKGALGLRLDSDQPVTAGLRSVVGDDLSHAVAAPPVQERAGTVLGAGPRRLVLAGAEAVAEVVVELRTADGEELDPVRVSLQPGAGARVALPAAARRVELVTGGVALRAAIEQGPPGLAVRPLEELVLTSDVPDVRPGLY